MNLSCLQIITDLYKPKANHRYKLFFLVIIILKIVKMPYDPDDDERQTVTHTTQMAQMVACGVIMSPALRFTDFSGMKTKPPSSSAPRWRYYEPGLNIEGKHKYYLSNL